jgi:putative tryptophan/tyrosine transport system substrate-binding protein
LLVEDILFGGNSRKLVELIAKYRLPAMYSQSAVIDVGGLMSYSVDNSDMLRRLAGHVDKILRGARPGDLPIEQPTKFELVINLKTAKALGLTIPPSVLLRADRLIQ